MKNLSIRTKLLISFALLALMIIPQGVYFFLELNHAGNTVLAIVNVDFPEIMLLEQMNSDAIHIKYLAENVDVPKDTKRKTNYPYYTPIQHFNKNELLAHLDSINRLGKKYQLIHNLKNPALNAQALSMLLEKITVSAFDLFSLKEKTGIEKQRDYADIAVKNAHLTQLVDQLTKMINNALSNKNKYMKNLGADIRASQKALYLFSSTFSSIAFLLTIALAVALAFFMSTRIAQPIVRLTEFAKKAPYRLNARIEVNSTDEVGSLAKSINNMLEKINDYQKKLTISERQAGMADVASSVLHNVGNVLNSINTSLAVIEEKLEKSKMDHLTKLVALMQEHQTNLGEFITQDPKGRHILEYLSLLSNAWQEDKKNLHGEIVNLIKRAHHIQHVIKEQNSLATLGSVAEKVDIAEFVDEAIRINKEKCEQLHIEIIRQYAVIEKPVIDQLKVMQILVNLIKNSVEAINEYNGLSRYVIVSIRHNPDDARYFLISVEDSGVGISADDLKKMFRMRYTTKVDGHGFGLHSSAIAAEELGGRLLVSSPGKGQGATFTLELPYRKSQVKRGDK